MILAGDAASFSLDGSTESGEHNDRHSLLVRDLGRRPCLFGTAEKEAETAKPETRKADSCNSPARGLDRSLRGQKEEDVEATDQAV